MEAGGGALFSASSHSAPGCHSKSAITCRRATTMGSHKKWLCIGGHFGQKYKIDSGRQTMQAISAKEAKYNFGKLIDMARAAPITVEKHGRAVVVVLAVEEYERLKAMEAGRNG